MTLFLAIVTVACWGSWLAPTQNVRMPSQYIKTFYVSAAFLALALIIALSQKSWNYTLFSFFLPFAGGVIWSISSVCAFVGTDRLGLAKAVGIWSPMNIVVSIIWGAVLFQELLNLSRLNLYLMLMAVAMMITGVLMIVFARGSGTRPDDPRRWLTGIMGAVGAGILWGAYFIPMKLTGTSAWVSSFPFAVGMFVAGCIMILLVKQPIRLEKTGDYVRVFGSGIIWGIGNYTMLVLTDLIGAGKGFSIAQLAVVVNALAGIYILKDPRLKTRAATLTLVGCVLAMVGGIVLGNLK